MCWSGLTYYGEGLDIPEVSLVAILDADKEGFLRSERSLIQTIGRAARNLMVKQFCILIVLLNLWKKPLPRRIAVVKNK